MGGIPCARCKRAKQPCDGETSYDVLDAEAQTSLKRIAELEELVRELVQKSQTGAPLPDVNFEGVLAGGTGGFVSAIGGSSGTVATTALPPDSAMPNVRFDLPSISHTDDTSFARHDAGDGGGYQAGPSMQNLHDYMVPQQHPHAMSYKPASMPNNVMTTQSFNALASISPQNGSNSLHGAPMSSPAPAAARDSPASRLAVAQDSSIMQPPFRPLLIRSKAWDNKQPSRPGSPSSIEDAWYFEGTAGPQSDPVSHSIIDIEMAKQLFDL
jgi:hypothetical protein